MSLGMSDNTVYFWVKKNILEAELHTGRKFYSARFECRAFFCIARIIVERSRTSSER